MGHDASQVGTRQPGVRKRLQVLEVAGASKPVVAERTAHPL